MHFLHVADLCFWKTSFPSLRWHFPILITHYLIFHITFTDLCPIGLGKFSSYSKYSIFPFLKILLCLCHYFFRILFQIITIFVKLNKYTFLPIACIFIGSNNRKILSLLDYPSLSDNNSVSTNSSFTNSPESSKDPKLLVIAIIFPEKWFDLLIDYSTFWFH